MCEECNPIESNTGVIHYSGPDLVICNGNTITNGELLTSVIAKIDNCIGALQFELDFTGLVENSPCINLTKTSLQTVLQSILNTESAYCTQLQTLNTQITNLQTQVNNLLLAKPVVVTACDPSRVQLTQGNVVNTFKVNGLVPPKTILPYFGLPTDFSPTGLGIAGTQTAGWAIANGNNGTINALNQFIKYGPSAITASSGSNTVTLDAPNIPEVSFTTNANFTLSGETDEDGLHRHNMMGVDQMSWSSNPDDGQIPEDYGQGAGDFRIEWNDDGPAGWSAKTIGDNGLHTHTFNAEATGSFNAVVGNTEPESFSVVPVHIQAIPIQWVGCS
jgi:hypothetical protein